MSDRKRLQLNLRLDGRDDLLEAVKNEAERLGLSVNAYVVSVLEQATGLSSEVTSKISGIEATIEALLDKKLDERLGKHAA
jgi:hypothetical protein